MPQFAEGPGLPFRHVFSRWTLSLLVVCALAVSCGNKDASPPGSASVDPKSANGAAAASAARPEFARLPGRWARADGDYVLEVKSVDGAGTMDAAYFNPNPINVSRAAALYQGGEAKVLIELRDRDYPGCTYSLTYDPKTDQLYGQYYQAALRQTFEVTFARMK